MPSKKPKNKHAKAGPKTASKAALDKQLLALFNEDGITYSHAAEITKCSRQYASNQFKIFGDKIEANKQIYESWIEKNDRVRDRALEGLSRNVKNCDDNIVGLKEHLKKAQSVQAAIIPKMVDTVNDSEIGRMLKHVDFKVTLAIYQELSKDLNMYKNYGYYVETISNNLRAETILKAELQQQYDTIEILPPASEVLDREIERRIAEKQHLQPINSEAQVQEAKNKK
jgi:Ni,Fe-hydrogenase I large subunit